MIYKNSLISFSCSVYSYRLYGQPKLDKPKELKGIKESFSVDFVPKKCSCPCFIEGNNLWIKHRDFFSTSWKPPHRDMNLPEQVKYFGGNKRNRFVYPDSWGDVVLRNEAWIVFKSIIPEIISEYRPLELIQGMLDSFLKSDFCIKNEIDDLSLDWERFFEAVIKELGRNVRT